MSTFRALSLTLLALALFLLPVRSFGAGSYVGSHSSYSAYRGNVQGSLHAGRVFQMNGSVNANQIGLAQRQQVSQWKQRQSACGVTQNGVCTVQVNKRNGNYWATLN